MDNQVTIAVKRTIRQYRTDNKLSTNAMRELKTVLRRLKTKEKEPSTDQSE